MSQGFGEELSTPTRGRAGDLIKCNGGASILRGGRGHGEGGKNESGVSQVRENRLGRGGMKSGPKLLVNKRNEKEKKGMVQRSKDARNLDLKKKAGKII